MINLRVEAYEAKQAAEKAKRESNEMSLRMREAQELRQTQSKSNDQMLTQVNGYLMTIRDLEKQADIYT